MKYYTLQKAIYRKDIGKHFTQTEEVKDIDFLEGIPRIEQLHNLPYHHVHLTNHEFPNFKPRIKFRLKEGAKLTDVLGIPNMNAYGFFLSEKFKNLLEKFNLMEHKFYEGQLYLNDSILRYFWFHPKENNFEWIDFDKTDVFFKYNDAPPIKINNYDEYQSKYHNKGGFELQNINLKKDIPNFDLFYLPFVNYGCDFFISESLMNVIIKEKITGIEIKEQDIFYV